MIIRLELLHEKHVGHTIIVPILVHVDEGLGFRQRGRLDLPKPVFVRWVNLMLIGADSQAVPVRLELLFDGALSVITQTLPEEEPADA